MKNGKVGRGWQRRKRGKVATPLLSPLLPLPLFLFTQGNP
jgi:hypothetical protein